MAQLPLNTLKSPIANLKDNTFDVVNGEGQIVITGGNGTASVNKPAAKIGETVTVSYKANAGYELDYIQVNGTKIATNDFNMTVIPTTVYAAFKATAPVTGEVEDKAVWTGTNNEEGTYKLIDAEAGGPYRQGQGGPDRGSELLQGSDHH